MTGSPCAVNDMVIKNKTDVKFRGQTKIRVVLSTTGDAFRIEAPATRITIDNFEIVGDGGPFNEGVVIAAPTPTQMVSHITLNRIDVTDATVIAGVSISSAGSDVCVNGTTVTGAGLDEPTPRATGFRVVVPQTQGTLQRLRFVGSSAENSDLDGFAIDHSPLQVSSMRCLMIPTRSETTATDSMWLVARPRS